MLTVETYIKHMDCFVKIEPDTDIELVTDVFYVEGAIGLLIIIGNKKYMVEKKEFFLALLSAADVFYQYLEQCDVSVLERKNKIREIRKKLI